MYRCAFIVVPAILFSVSSEAFAQGATTGGEAPAFNALDTFWVIFAAVLVFFMQAGLGLVEAGLVRMKSINTGVRTRTFLCFRRSGWRSV